MPLCCFWFSSRKGREVISDGNEKGQFQMQSTTSTTTTANNPSSAISASASTLSATSSGLPWKKRVEKESEMVISLYKTKLSESQQMLLQQQQLGGKSIQGHQQQPGGTVTSSIGTNSTTTTTNTTSNISSSPPLIYSLNPTAFTSSAHDIEWCSLKVYNNNSTNSQNQQQHQQKILYGLERDYQRDKKEIITKDAQALKTCDMLRNINFVIQQQFSTLFQAVQQQQGQQGQGDDLKMFHLTMRRHLVSVYFLRDKIAVLCARFQTESPATIDTGILDRTVGKGVQNLVQVLESK